VFTTARLLHLYWAKLIQSTTSNPVSVISILILYSNLLQGLTSVTFPSGFRTKTVYHLFLSSIRTTCPAHHIVLDFITRITFIEKYRAWRSSLYSFLRSSVTFPFRGQNVFLSTLAYIFLLIWETKFQTHTQKKQSKNSSLFYNLCL
jgi:hypothetical protein